MFKCWLCVLLTVLWNGDIAAGLQQRALPSSLTSRKRWKTITPACSSAEVGSQVQKVKKVRQIQSSDLGSLKAARSEAFESEVRRLAVPVLIKGTHTPRPERDVCLAVKDVPGKPVPSRIISPLELMQVPGWRQRHNWHRHNHNVSWRTFCNRMTDYEVQTKKHGVASSLGENHTIPLYAKLPIPEELNAAGYAGLFFYTPSHGPAYRESKLWIGSKGAQTPLHEDPLDNIASQLSGKKRWHLFPPDHFRELDYLNFTEPWTHIGGKCSWSGHGTGGVRWSNYSMLTQEDVPPVPNHLVVEVQAGDSLYIPGFWGHKVESLETSVMTNYWFHDMWSCCGGHGGIVDENATKAAITEISGTSPLKSKSLVEFSSTGQLVSQRSHGGNDDDSDAKPADGDAPEEVAKDIKNTLMRRQPHTHENVMSSQALEIESISHDRKIQAAAEKLEPGATQDFLQTLRICAPCHTYARLGEKGDGGYVMCEDGLGEGLVGAYSYGIKGYDGWGMAVASKYSVPLHEYDCTNAKEPTVCHGCTVHFHGDCILSNNAQPKHKFKTMTEQLLDAGSADAAERSLLLKIDVEGAEWSVFAEEPTENLKKFRQIVVEYHGLGQTEKHDLYLKAVKKIEGAGFAVTHLHGNNCCGMVTFGEFSIPHTLEVTYIQKPSAGCAANVPYHTPLDQPNMANKPELPDAHLPTNHPK